VVVSKKTTVDWRAGRGVFGDVMVVVGGLAARRGVLCSLAWRVLRARRVWECD